MKYLALNFDTLAPAIREKINDEEVQQITLGEDYYYIEIVVSKEIEKVGTGFVWDITVVSANVYTTDGEMIASQLFGMEKLAEKIGKVETKGVLI
jgi:hypothetical protein